MAAVKRRGTVILFVCLALGLWPAGASGAAVSGRSRATLQDALHQAAARRSAVSSAHVGEAQRLSAGAVRLPLATSQAAGDPAGDNGWGYDPRGDLLAFGVGNDGTTIAVAAVTSAFDDPASSYNWAAYGLGDPGWLGPSGIDWSLDVNGDGQSDYEVLFLNDGLNVYAVVTRASDGTTLCDATPISGSDLGYAASFPASCIGRPSQVRASAYMRYETVSDISEDTTGWTIAASVPPPPSPIATHTTFNCKIRSKANGKYVTAELHDTGAMYGVLRARSSTYGGWEKFQCIAVGANQWLIKSLANGKFVTAELHDTGAMYGALRARSTTHGSWETYTFSAVASCSCFVVRGANAKLVSAELHYAGSTYGLLGARSTNIGTWEQFNITPG